MPAPSANTIRARVGAVKAELTAKRREGVKSAAARRLQPAAGVTPDAGAPMAVLQIDHTQVDIILVDEAHRKPIGRPWLTVAIDVYSRCIAGFLLSLDPPCATSVGLCLTHAALPKEAFLNRVGVEGFSWPVQGRPGRLYVDNGADFHSQALTRGCEQHGIELDYRPVATPHFGGVVERLIGTVMQMVHELPGTTFSHPGERGDYDSDGAACLTLAELERWLTLAIVGRYHGEVHDGLDEPPLARWRRGVEVHGRPRAVGDARTFLIDFLPVLRRRVTREGVRVDHISYYSEALRPWIADRASLGSFLIRRDPRDLSRVFVLDPEGGVYVEAPCARQERPSIACSSTARPWRRSRQRGAPRSTRRRSSARSRPSARPYKPPRRAHGRLDAASPVRRQRQVHRRHLPAARRQALLTWTRLQSRSASSTP